MRTFANKRVALIGPAPHIIETDQREKLAGYDVIVRVNNALPLSSKVKDCTGKQTDVLYACYHVPPHRSWRKLREIRLRPNAVWRKDFPFAKWRPHRKRIVVLHPSLLWGFREMVCNPNTGMIAVADILSERPKELYLTGFTFYQNAGEVFEPDYIRRKPDDADEAKAKRGNIARHDQAKQLAWFRQQDLSCVTMDGVLKEIVQNDMAWQEGRQESTDNDESIHPESNP